MTTESNRSTIKPLPVASAPRPAAGEETGYLERMARTLEIAEQATDQADQLVRPVAGESPSAPSALALSVVIPVYNERDTIREIVARIRAVGMHHEIIIVDDYSVDGTRQILLEMAAAADIRVLWHGYNRGKGAALRTAFQHVRGEVVLIQDADLEYNPADYPRLLAPLEQDQADVVYGSRFLANARQDPSRLHRLGNWLLTTASNLTTGQRLTDMETGYKVFRRKVLESLELEQNRFGFEPELTAKISRLGYRIHEVPIRYQSRSYEEGKKISALDGFQALWCIARYGS
jgi:glycosyltransferase involved in cell wall biosynthesis